FHIRYSMGDEIPYFSYGLAGDAEGNVSEVEYDIRGLLNYGLPGNAKVFADNRLRVTTCLKPITLVTTLEGLLTCVPPINEVESARAARQEPLETTVCAVVQNPAAFNNKLVRIRGHVSVSMEYSMLDGDGCSSSMWFTYADGSGPPELVAHIGGGAMPGAFDPEGRRILPIPLSVVRNSKLRRFEELLHRAAEADRLDVKRHPDSYVSRSVAATFVGRIDGVSDDIHRFHLKRKETDRADYLGFGHMGLFDAQFVLQSVETAPTLETSSSNMQTH
ncbi:MAG TPA: hypothetical protein VFM21_12725, partial [Terriglobia bacterium]|nr:hypothetical protein [Terriglobia bacterium]